jgi:two-component system sensor histidine kinase/response regulator
MKEQKKELEDLLKELSDLQKRIKELESDNNSGTDIARDRLFLRAIIDNLPDAIYVKDKESRKIIANLTDVKNLGLNSEEELLSKTDFDFYPEEIAEGFLADDRSVLQTGKGVINREEFFIDKAGKKHWLLTSKIPLKDHNNNIIGIIGIGRDITERKIAEEALEYERNFLKTLIDCLPDAIYAKDAAGRKTIANLADLWNMGYTSEKEVLGKTDYDFFPKEIADKFFANDHSIIETGKAVINREEYFFDKEGNKHWLQTSKVPLRNNKYEVVGLIGISRDITSQKIAEEELKNAYKKLGKTNEDLKKANRVKADFLANMSHEIRTPLNAVIGLTELLLRTPLNNEQKDYVQTILNSGDILLSLINDILDFSKIEAQKIDLEKQPFDIMVCIEEALDLLAGKAEQKEIELAYSLTKGLPTRFMGDVTRLRQILVNLLSNSIKFTEKGEVVISISGQLLDAFSYKLNFTVRDTGIGIKPEVCKNLFQAFTQADASTTRKFGGTGLGLTISKRLSELMGGTMWVESEGIGKGSTFYFSIISELSNEKEKEKNISDIFGKKVLIVDDNKTNREILSQQFLSLNMKVDTVASGKGALALVEKGEIYDLLILDYHMPEMDGITLAGKIHETLKDKTPRLILLSSYSYRERKSDLSQFAAVLTKPLKLSHLPDVLHTIFSKKEAIHRKFDPSPLPENTEIGKQYPLRILLAEDNKINQMVALRSLEKMGYRADTAFNGIEVLEALKYKSFDLILMDIQMPDMDGEQAAIEIRKLFPEEPPRILAMTATAVKTELDRYMTVGMNGYLVKPFKQDKLREVLIESYNKLKLKE